MTYVLHPVKKMANNYLLLALGVVLTLVSAAIGFSVVENQSILDGFYWASTTLTSVGYGDLSPATAAGKVLTIAFQLWSMFVLLPCAVAVIIDLVRIDEHKETNEEQEWKFHALELIAAKVGADLPPQPADY